MYNHVAQDVHLLVCAYASGCQAYGNSWDFPERPGAQSAREEEGPETPWAAKELNRDKLQGGHGTL